MDEGAPLSATENADLKCYIQAPTATKDEIASYAQTLFANVTPSAHPMDKTNVKTTFSSPVPVNSPLHPLLDTTASKNAPSSPLPRVKSPLRPLLSSPDSPLFNKSECRPDIMLRACQSRIMAGMVKGAIELCHDTLVHFYEESMEVTKHLQRTGTVHQPLIFQLIKGRNTIAALWCTYAQILLDIACFLEDRGGNEPMDFFDGKKLQPLLHTKEQRRNVMMVLVQEAINTLIFMTDCPLVGNHVFSTMGSALMVDLETTLYGSDGYICIDTYPISASCFIILDFQVIHDLFGRFKDLSVPDPMFADAYNQSLLSRGFFPMKDDHFVETGEVKSIITELDYIKSASRRLSFLPELPADYCHQLELLLLPTEVSTVFA
jgi:hypothetical protein